MFPQFIFSGKVLVWIKCSSQIFSHKLILLVKLSGPGGIMYQYVHTHTYVIIISIYKLFIL